MLTVLKTVLKHRPFQKVFLQIRGYIRAKTWREWTASQAIRKNCLHILKSKRELVSYFDVRFAVRKGYYDIVCHLIDRGYQFTYRLVDIAAGYGHFDIVKELVERAHVFHSSEGLYWAEYFRHRTVLNYLQELEKKQKITSGADKNHA